MPETAFNPDPIAIAIGSVIFARGIEGRACELQDLVAIGRWDRLQIESRIEDARVVARQLEKENQAFFVRQSIG